MVNPEIIRLTNKMVPTIVSYDPKLNSFIIGNLARDSGLRGRTNVFNFKLDVGKTDKVFSEQKNYWITPTGKPEDLRTLTAKDATLEFLKELLKDIELPSKIIVGEPAVNDEDWKTNFRKHVREVLEELNFGTPQFLYEPFAVFQYYRNVEKTLVPLSKAEIVLIIDVGGGTFSSCIIRTTNEGDLARMGALSVPLGLRAELVGGFEIDKALLIRAVEKSTEKGVVWKDNPINRVEGPYKHVMLLVEDAKIKLSKAIGQNVRLADDLSDIVVPLSFEGGSLHPERDINIELSGEDLKAVIRRMWRKHYGRIIIDTVNEAEKQLSKLKIELKEIDKVLIAGGSSRLPFMKEEVLTVLPNMVKKDGVFIGTDVGAAVAYGIAAECRERTRKFPELSVNRLAPCLMNEIYLGFRRTRKDPFVIPKIQFEGITNRDGRLISKPCELDELKLNFEIDLPFEAREKMFYGFFEQPIREGQDITPLNLVNDVFSIRFSGKIARRCELSLNIQQNGSVKPSFRFREEGIRAAKETIVVDCPEFYYEDLKIEEGYPFVGIDFGTSNSYVTRFLSLPRELKAATYPEFQIQDSVKEKLRELELENRKLRAEGIISRENVLAHAKYEKLLMVFHSNKIEGNPLTVGETSAVFGAENQNALPKREREAYNLEKAYNWLIENADGWKRGSEAFVRHINEMILEGVDKGGGEYRKKSVTISGMDFTPPHSASVAAFMEKLGIELRNGPGDRSVIEFAAAMHTKLVYIHPFIDANGRTARLLMSAILLSENLPVIVVNYDDKQRYLDALSKCNDGDISSLVVLFIEYFTQNIEEIRKGITEGEGVKEEIEFESRAEQGLIKAAMQEVGAKIIESPLTKIMQLKLEEQKKIQLISYESWKQGFALLMTEMKSIVGNFNAIDEYKHAGYRIRLNDYDMLSLDKYIDISQDKRVSRTWFLGIEMTGPISSVRMLFFFEHARYKIASKKNSSRVCLTLAMFDRMFYRRLTSEPISLREIGFADGQLVFMYNGDVVAEGTVGLALETFLAEVIKAYL